jgi:phage tail-like protein
MKKLRTSAKPALLNDLPAFFQEDLDSDPLHPIKALLQVFEDCVSDVEQWIENSDLLFDPETLSTLELGPRETQFLHWLAHWVALELDQDWLDPSEKPNDGAQPRNHRAVELIKDAAKLYRQRGTPRGFKAILERFHGREIEVLERSWPQGAQLELFSSVGVDFWLADEPKLQNCFVLVIHPTPLDREAVDPSIGTVESNLMGGSSPRKALWLLSPRGAEELGSPPGVAAAASDSVEAKPIAGINDSWTAKVDRIRRTVAKEKPAHTRYYLATPSVSREAAQPKFGSLVIAVSSTIGQDRIE